MTNLEPLSVRLQKGHDYLASHKWTRGFYWRDASGMEVCSPREDGSVCAMGAYLAGNGLKLHDPYGDAKYALSNAARREFVSFNDVVAHDKRDVLRKFRIAIRAARKRESANTLGN